MLQGLRSHAEPVKQMGTCVRKLQTRKRPREGGRDDSDDSDDEDWTLGDD